MKMTFKDLLAMQDELNVKALPEGQDWKQEFTQSDYKVAAVGEVIELMESFPWKWWKKGGTTDLWNAKIEAIDTVHFLASAMILANDENTDEEIGSEFEYVESSKNELRRDICKIITDISDGDYAFAIVSVLNMVGIGEEEFATIYHAKYALNKLRWQAGYGDAYKKHCSETGMEDNQFLEQLVIQCLKNEALPTEEMVADVVGFAIN